MNEKEAALSLDEARAILAYDAGTGELTWRKSARRGWVGKPAGTPHSRGYVSVNISRRIYLAHRLAWFLHYGRWPSGQVDHRDGDRANNSIANLREATQSQNSGNMRMRPNNRCGFKGVCLDQNGRYQAQITKNGRQRGLGRFSTPEEAHAAYVAAAKQAFGEFARAA